MKTLIRIQYIRHVKFYKKETMALIFFLEKTNTDKYV